MTKGKKVVWVMSPNAIATLVKMKGIATVELADGSICEAESRWYEAHEIGRKDFKIKRVIG